MSSTQIKANRKTKKGLLLALLEFLPTVAKMLAPIAIGAFQEPLVLVSKKLLKAKVLIV